ncbi:MAG: CooT family nickel-binding protein [Desulfobacula sp.]|nr:CooT family nickel-binding protein [Desulfobacula sp.]
MCESNVYLKKNQEEKLIMENAASVTPFDKDFFLIKGILGERLEVKATLEDINLMRNKILLKAM